MNQSSLAYYEHHSLLYPSHADSSVQHLLDLHNLWPQKVFSTVPGLPAMQVLYNLFEWPTMPGARLAVVGVANTMDLPERLLPRIASRLGGHRITFQPYRREQLETIVHARLKAADAIACFDIRALSYAARKVVWAYPILHSPHLVPAAAAHQCS